MLPKIRITSKKASNKSCSELNFMQKSPRAHTSISRLPPEWSYGTRKIDRVEILNCIETVNCNQVRAQHCQKYALHRKKLQIKVV